MHSNRKNNNKTSTNITPKKKQTQTPLQQPSSRSLTTSFSNLKLIPQTHNSTSTFPNLTQNSANQSDDLFEQPPIASRYTPKLQNARSKVVTLRKTQMRFMGTPAGDAHPSFKKKHPSVNDAFYNDPNNNAGALLGNDGSMNPLLLGQDNQSIANLDKNRGKNQPNQLSSAAFAATTITDTSITIGSQTVSQLPSASMANIDSDLLQFIDNKSWLTARKVDNDLPPGLPVKIQTRIRTFQQKLPAPVHVDTASILSLPKNLGGFGFEHLTFIQGRLLPMIASGLDILLRSPTSSGKTLAYAIPLLERLLYSRHAANSHDIPILVLVPSRELALQTSATIKHLLSLHRRNPARHFGVFALIGGSSAMRVEQEPLQRTDISFLVSTTSRLMDHIENTPGFKERLKECKMVVFDEVDYLLAQTGGQDVGKVLDCLHPQRQTIMMSATLTPAVRKVASFALRKGACVVDVVKDSIVSLGTGIVSAFTKTDANRGESEEGVKDNRVGKFDQDDHDLLVKRQQDLVGHFVDQDGNRVHIDHAEVMDKVGTGQKVYEKMAFKKLHELENLKKLKAQFDDGDGDGDDGDDGEGYEYITEIDPITLVKSLKKVAKKRTQNKPDNDVNSSSMVSSNSNQNQTTTTTHSQFNKTEQDLLHNAGFKTTTPNTGGIDQSYDKLRKLKGQNGQNGGTDEDFDQISQENDKFYSQTDDQHSQSKQKNTQNGAIGDKSTNNMNQMDQDEDTNPYDVEDHVGAQSSTQNSLKRKIAELNAETALENANNRGKNQQDINGHVESQRKIEDIVRDARAALNSVNVGPISALMKQNEDIADELALYTDDEDDPGLVTFDEVNANVQHYVQAASTAESLQIIARLFDDIGGRYLFAKQQVDQHNYKVKHDFSYDGVELEPPRSPKIIVFCETARYAQYLTGLFRQVIDLDKNNAFEALLELHSKKGQNFRTRVAQQFSSPNWSAGCILFSSDVAARGLDTQDVDCVIQLGLPPSRQQWVHRVGRVARDGDQQGLSLTLVSPQHVAQFSRMASGLPIHVPKVGTLGLGLKQDKFNNNVVDPTQSLKLGYSPTVPSKFGKLGEFFDLDSPGDISGQLRLTGRQQHTDNDVKLLENDVDVKVKKVNKTTVPKQDPYEDVQKKKRGQQNADQNEKDGKKTQLSLFDELRDAGEDDIDEVGDDFYMDRENFMLNHQKKKKSAQGEQSDKSDRNDNNDNNDNNNSFQLENNYEEGEFDPNFDGAWDDNGEEGSQDEEYDPNGEYSQSGDQDEAEEAEEEDTGEQTLWHGCIERSVSSIYVNRIKDENDRKERVDALNQMSMSANTSELSTDLYARYDFILDKVLKSKIIKDEEMRLNAERAYISYLGHHMALFHRSHGVEERLKAVKLSKTPFKNKEQVAKLALEFAKGIGLCGPKGELPPPAISQSTATRLGFTDYTPYINIGTPTQFSHVVEIERQTHEKQAAEQAKIDHRVRRKYWEAKQWAIQQGKPIPPPPKELIEQRERLSKERQKVAIARQQRQDQVEEERRIRHLQTRMGINPGGKLDPADRDENDFQFDGRNNSFSQNQPQAESVIPSTPFSVQELDIHTALPGTLRTATPRTRKTVMVDFSDDETAPAVTQANKAHNQLGFKNNLKNQRENLQNLQQTQYQYQNAQTRQNDRSLPGQNQQNPSFKPSTTFSEALNMDADTFNQKMNAFFPNNQKIGHQQRGTSYGENENDPVFIARQNRLRREEENSKLGDQNDYTRTPRGGQGQGKNPRPTNSKFFEEHQNWLKQQEHRNALRSKMSEQQIAEDAKAQKQYDKAFKQPKERSKREPAPGRELLEKSSMYSKEPRRIRTGEVDHKVHLDIVL
jgi:superfamily II DNA/RNA helicase